MKLLPYDPGILPTKPAPQKGAVIEFQVDGYPPYKDKSFSIRNIGHRNYGRFTKLRECGIKAMAGRAWTHRPVSVEFLLFAPVLEKGRRVLDYWAGIEDTLDGSSGSTFTYLPVVFEDDCQISVSKTMRYIKSEQTKYTLRFEIL